MVVLGLLVDAHDPGELTPQDALRPTDPVQENLVLVTEKDMDVPIRLKGDPDGERGDPSRLDPIGNLLPNGGKPEIGRYCRSGRPFVGAPDQWEEKNRDDPQAAPGEDPNHRRKASKDWGIVSSVNLS